MVFAVTVASFSNHFERASKTPYKNSNLNVEALIPLEFALKWVLNGIGFAAPARPSQPVCRMSARSYRPAVGAVGGREFKFKFKSRRTGIPDSEPRSRCDMPEPSEPAVASGDQFMPETQPARDHVARAPGRVRGHRRAETVPRLRTVVALASSSGLKWRSFWRWGPWSRSRPRPSEPSPLPPRPC